MVDTKQKVYVFKVTQDGYPGKDEEGEVFSEMVLKGTTSLHKFAKTIIGAFNLDMDAPFCFFSKMHDADGRMMEHTNMAHIEHISTTYQHERSVKNSYIHEMFEPGKELFFHCDFEHNNTYSVEFLVSCCGIIEAEVGETYPKVLYVVK